MKTWSVSVYYSSLNICIQIYKHFFIIRMIIRSVDVNIDKKKNTGGKGGGGGKLLVKIVRFCLQSYFCLAIEARFFYLICIKCNDVDQRYQFRRRRQFFFHDIKIAKNLRFGKTKYCGGPRAPLEPPAPRARVRSLPLDHSSYVTALGSRAL